MVFNRIRPLSSEQDLNDIDARQQQPRGLSSIDNLPEGSGILASDREFTDVDSISTVNFGETSYLKLRPFNRLDPTLCRLIKFLKCFGLFVTLDTESNGGDRLDKRASFGEQALSKRSSNNSVDNRRSSTVSRLHLDKPSKSSYSRYIRIILTFSVAFVTAEVVYDVNLRQSKLLAEQKRSTPLLTFVIVAYSWLTLVIPVICDLSLIIIGPHLFRFYSRTTSTVCNGMFFGKKTSVDSWYYYVMLLLIAFLDVVGQVVLLGVWPNSIDPYMRMLLTPDTKSIVIISNEGNVPSTNSSNYEPASNVSDLINERLTNDAQLGHYGQQPQIRALLIDTVLGEKYAHGDLGVCVKIICLMVQFIHSYAFLMIIISLANHYATAINSINDNLDKYEFRRLLKQLIILRDSSEQISLMISIPFSLIIMLVFMRQIALNGVFIQSTMQPFENWAVSLQSFTCSLSIFMVFIYCDGLQSASKQTHRLKTEQTVINENRGGNQSIYEFLDYLDRLSKSIRITFFNIIAINKSSLVALYGHILTLTFVTS